MSLKLVPIGLDNVKEHRKTSRPHVQLTPGKFDPLNFELCKERKKAMHLLTMQESSKRIGNQPLIQIRSMSGMFPDSSTWLENKRDILGIAQAGVVIAQANVGIAKASVVIVQASVAIAQAGVVIAQASVAIAQESVVIAQTSVVIAQT